MQRFTASLCLALATIAAIFNTVPAEARYAPLEDAPAIQDYIVNRNIVAETHLYCLALAIYFEGGSTGETEEGQRHIARVVVERARANRQIWGGSDICDVIFYKRSKTCQFSFACLPLARRTPRSGPAWRYSVAIAEDELAGKSNVELKLIRYYMNAALSAPKNACRFRKEFVPVVQAGRHEFFREATANERRELEKADYAECRTYAESLKKKKHAKGKKKNGRAVAALKKPAGKNLKKYAKR